MANKNLYEYNCWDEWDEVDYGDSWEEYDNYTDWDEYDDTYGECYGYGVYEECDSRDQDYGECSVGDETQGGTTPPSGMQRIVDLATSSSVDKYIFTYIIYDSSTKVMVASTNQEEHFVLVKTPNGFKEHNGEYYVKSAADVSFSEVERSIDRLRKEYPSVAEEDIRFISESKGTMLLYEGVRTFIYANQKICRNMAYSPIGAQATVHTYLKVQNLIEMEVGSRYTIDYNSKTQETFVRSNTGTLYYVTVANPIFYNDERYVYASYDVDIQELCTVKEWIMKHHDVAQADIAEYSDRITFTDSSGCTYKILVNDLPVYIYYDYDYYIPANSNIEAVLDYMDSSVIPPDYYRVVKEIQMMTGLTAEQDEKGLIVLYGISFYVTNAVRYNGWIYAKRQSIISSMLSAFEDIDRYLLKHGFYYGTDDNGSNYTALTYKSQQTWLLGKLISIADRIRINDSQGNNYYNLTVSAENIENAVQTAFGVSVSYLGARALEQKTVKSYIEKYLYIRKSRVSVSSTSLNINDKSHKASDMKTTFKSTGYFDKTKILSAVQALTPDVSVAKVETVLGNGEDYAYIAGNKARVTFTTSQLDHVSIGLKSGNTTTWVHNTTPTNSMSMLVDLNYSGSCTLIVRGRTTMEPSDVGLTSISHSKECTVNHAITIMEYIPDNMVYIVPYAKQQGCTVTDNGSNVSVKYIHRYYPDGELCTYYKSLLSTGAYKRQALYTSSGLYIDKETFRMDMDLDIMNDPHNDRDWYLEKRIWRLWSLGKSANFSSEMTDEYGKKYINVNMNGIVRKVYSNPADNAFYGSIILSGQSRMTIRTVNNHLVMPESVMYNLFSELTDAEKYILANYKMNNPSENLKSNLNEMLLFDKKIDMNCISLAKKTSEIQLMAADNTQAFINYASETNIEAGMTTYRNDNLVNVFDQLDKKRQKLFEYDSKNHVISFDGFKVDIPSLICYPIKKTNPTQEDYKAALYANLADIAKIDTYRRIVVYGGGMGGVCAAYKAAQYAWSLEGFDNFEILLINPVPDPRLGGIGTVGGQNFWDTRDWDGKFPYRGSLEDLMGHKIDGSGVFRLVEDRYNTDEKADALSNLLTPYNVKIYEQHDIAVNQDDVPVPVEQDGEGNIVSITIKKIIRGSNGVVKYVENAETINGDIFIDASEDGKLTKLTAHDSNGKPAYTRGRYDYPADTLNKIPKDESYGEFDEGTEEGARMPAVTLMFKLAAEDIVEVVDSERGTGYYNCGNAQFNQDKDEAGNEILIKKFNEKFKNTRFMLKPINSAWNGGKKDSKGNYEWWLNTLLIFGVDGSLHNRDIDESSYVPLEGDEFDAELDFSRANVPNRVLSSDDAWKLGRAFLKKYAAEIIPVYQQLGYKNAYFVRESNNEDADIVTGDILYVRETIHAVKDVNKIANGTENTNYEVSMRHCHYSYLNDEEYNINRNQSIGLIYYNSDIHPFMKSDYRIDDNYYISGYNSYRHIRPDMGKELADNSPFDPAYVPYSALTTKYVPNMLICGYAVNASSFAWSEMRVLPNLCVLGDAAGIAAVTCLLSGDSAYGLSDIEGVRTILKKYKAILDIDELK